MSTLPIPSSIDPDTGKTRLRTSLERAKNGGPPSIGQWMEFPGYTLARTIASLGSDWVLIDLEHGAIDDAAMHVMVGAIASAGSSPIVRVAGAEAWQLKRALDAGAHGVMVPMCDTAEQAAAIAAATHYPIPTGTSTSSGSSGGGGGVGSGGASGGISGTRGHGGLFASTTFNLPPPTYLHRANALVTIIVQIESRAAVANAAAIAAVSGIDALFVGPNDLAASMGYFALDHASVPEVQSATAHVLEAAKGEGKFAGHFALGAEAAAACVGRGWEFVNCGADVVAVGAWMGREMGLLRGLIEEGKVEVVKEEEGEGEGWDGRDWG